MWPQNLKPEAHFSSKRTVLTGSGTSAEFPLRSEHWCSPPCLLVRERNTSCGIYGLTSWCQGRGTLRSEAVFYTGWYPGWGSEPTGTLYKLAEVSTVARTSPGPETPCTMGHSPSAPVSLGVRLLLRLQTVLCPQLKSWILGLGRMWHHPSLPRPAQCGGGCPAGREPSCCPGGSLWSSPPGTSPEEIGGWCLLLLAPSHMPLAWGAPPWSAKEALLLQPPHSPYPVV